jgi:rhodanese-like protein
VDLLFGCGSAALCFGVFNEYRHAAAIDKYFVAYEISDGLRRFCLPFGGTMQRKYSFAAILMLAALVFAGCNSKAVQTPTTNTQSQNNSAGPETVVSDGARRMTVVEAQDLIKKGQVFVVDVRNQASYDAGHIPGSKLIPEAEIITRVSELPKDKTILTYCS